jgi:hypothetical protein
LERRARGRAGGVQILIGDEAGAGAIELGQQRAARVPRNGGNRSDARTNAEAVQSERSFGFSIKGHASWSFRADAAPPAMWPWSAIAVSRLRHLAFRDHGGWMKFWKE